LWGIDAHILLRIFKNFFFYLFVLWNIVYFASSLFYFFQKNTVGTIRRVCLLKKKIDISSLTDSNRLK